MNTGERNKKRAAENKDIHILFSEGREHTVKGISFFRGGRIRYEIPQSLCLFIQIRPGWNWRDCSLASPAPGAGRY